MLGLPTLTPINPAQLACSYWELHGLCSGKLGLILCHLNIFVHYLAHTQKHLEMYSGHRPNWIICLHFPHDLKLQLLQQAVGFLFSFLNSFFFPPSLLKSQQSHFKPLAVAWVCICVVQNGSCIHTGWEKKFPATSLQSSEGKTESRSLGARHNEAINLRDACSSGSDGSINPLILSSLPVQQEWHPPTLCCIPEPGMAHGNKAALPDQKGKELHTALSQALLSGAH